MNLNFGLQGSQVQSLSINAQIIQSLKLLQLNQQELKEFICEQLEKNPLLEASFPGENTGASEEAGGPVHHDSGDAGSAKEAPNPGAQEANLPLQVSSPLMADSHPRGKGNSRENGDFVSDTLASTISFREHLRRQVGVSFRDAQERFIADAIVESLDDDGYLRTDLGIIADTLGVSDAVVETVLLEVQQFEPAGIAARNLRECLSLQLAERSQLDAAMTRLLDRLELVAQHDYRRLAVACGVSTEQIRHMVGEIRKLNPRPGLGLDSEPVIYAVPDVAVTVDEDGTLVTTLIPSALPRVLVNHSYYSEVKALCTKGGDAKFVADCFKGANWLVRVLDQRAQTILKVATSIAFQQREFFLHGPAHLKPLNLRDVAEAIGVHQSTVSRAVSNKYVLTNRGLFELKYFFSNSVPVAEGSADHSSDTVRHKIKKMIAGESIDTILSDDAIVSRLRSEGIEIARRTVAKYRDSLRIPSSLQRRRLKENEFPSAGRSARSGAVTQRVALAVADVM